MVVKERISSMKNVQIHITKLLQQVLTEKQKNEAGAGQEVMRISIGIEHVDDLIEDLRDALKKI